MVNVQEISEQSPLVFKSGDEFLSAVMGFLRQQVGMTDQQAQQQITQSEVCTRRAKEILKEKGYAVKNHTVFTNLVAHVPSIKRGRDMWYNTKAIMQIPDKK